MEIKQEDKQSPTYSTESGKKEEKGSNFTPRSILKTKRHAFGENGMYCQATWLQQFNSLCRLWGKEEKQKAKSRKPGKKQAEG